MKIYKLMTVITILLITGLLTAKNAPEKESFDGTVAGSKATIRPDQQNRVHRAGIFWMNVNNTGYFGNPSNLDDPCTGKEAVSGELPGGSGTDFLFAGSILFGGYLNDGSGYDADSTQVGTIFEGPYVTTAYEGWSGENGGNDMARECWPVMFDDDPSGATLGDIVETSNVEGRISCLFEEVYDPVATAEEQFNLMYTDKLTGSDYRIYIGKDDYDNRLHYPLGMEVRQKTYAWSYDYAQKFVIIDYTLYNRNPDHKDMYDFFMGVYLDCDIGMIGGDWPGNSADDLGGFIEKWDKYVDPATNEQKTVDLNLAWAADNDGRNYTGDNGDGTDATDEPGAGEPLDGATSIATVRVLRNPNPNLRYSFNMYVAHTTSEEVDWGPRWLTGLHGPGTDPVLGIDPLVWQYDLTPGQKGYDDTNYDEWQIGGYSANPNGNLLGGRTEGRPCSDTGRYMVMSNDEFDYNQTALREVFLGYDTQIDGTEIPQAEKWQRYTTPDHLGETEERFADYLDGDYYDLNTLANGADVKYLLSFGPLGTEAVENVAIDPDGNGIYESLPGKTVWKFAYGDSLKLTLAFIVNENFHTSLDQDPNYTISNENEEVNLEDGIDPSLYAKGWYDALNNVIWAERVYDIPMYDTQVTKFGVTKGDGWYGEDVGRDGLYGDIKNDPYCWWFDLAYPGPDDGVLPDGTPEGEGDGEISSIVNSGLPEFDIYGHTYTNEDDLLPYGRETESPDEKYGITGDKINGDVNGYGYMVKYDNYIDPLPGVTSGDWIRYGFGNERLDAGDGVPDFTGPPPPPSPKIKMTYADNDVIIEWQSHEFFIKDDGYESFSGPEHYVDKFSRIKDFEGYQIQTSPDEEMMHYTELFSLDNVNYIYENVGRTGDYFDSPVNQAAYDSLMNAGLGVINEENKIWELRPYGNNRSFHNDYALEDVYTFTVDTAVYKMNAAENYTQDITYRKYKIVLHNKLLLQENYVAVTSSDFGDPRSGTPALKSNPASNGVSVIPTKISSTDDVYVVPNPYRGDVDYEAMGWENVDGADTWEEQDRKIAFMNIPLRSVIRIYTLAGDLVKTITHNGNTRVEARYQYGEYGAAWDLINDNDQAVASGIYLFSVQDVDDDGYEQVGKFVIIK